MTGNGEDEQTPQHDEATPDDPTDVAAATGGSMAYDEVDELDRDAIGRGEVGDA